MAPGIGGLERELEDARSRVAKLVAELMRQGIETKSESEGIHAAIVLKEHGHLQEALHIFRHLFDLGFQTDQSLFEYVQLLRRLDRDDEAETAVIKAVTEDGVCGDNLVREVIVTALAQASVGADSSGRLLNALALVLTKPGLHYEAEVANYLAREPVGETLRALEGLPFVTAEAIHDRTLRAVERREPFCVLRLGDGEGPFLRTRHVQPANRLLFERHRTFFTRRWFNDPALALNEAFLEVGRELCRRLAEADVIGIPDAAWLRHEIGLRNLQTIVNCLEVARGAIELAAGATGCRFTTTSAALDLEYRGLIGDVMKAASRLVLVTSHPNLADAIGARYGVVAARVIPIPPAQSDLGVTGYRSTERHFQDAFERVRSALREVDPGTLVLVAAGFLGKIYCLEAKRNGCIAIDVGSLADLWMGFMTRPGFHALPFLKLREPAAV